MPLHQLAVRHVRSTRTHVSTRGRQFQAIRTKASGASRPLNPRNALLRCACELKGTCQCLQRTNKVWGKAGTGQLLQCVIPRGNTSASDHSWIASVLLHRLHSCTIFFGCLSYLVVYHFWLSIHIAFLIFPYYSATCLVPSSLFTLLCARQSHSPTGVLQTAFRSPSTVYQRLSSHASHLPHRDAGRRCHCGSLDADAARPASHRAKPVSQHLADQRPQTPVGAMAHLLDWAERALSLRYSRVPIYQNAHS